MLSSHRHDTILKRLERDGRVRVTDLAKLLKVSEETVRRDLRELETRELLRRVHGGGIVFRPDEQPLADRSRIKQREKARVAELATGLIEPGTTIFLDLGSTALALAKAIPAGVELTVVTNSLEAARVLAAKSRIRVKVAPGWVRAIENAVLGADTIAFVRRFVFDVAFMGIAACDPVHGWMDNAEEESDLRRALTGQARRRVMLVDDSKFHLRGSVRTFDLREDLVVVTNRRPPEPFAEIFAEAGVDVVFERGGASGPHKRAKPTRRAGEGRERGCTTT